MTTAVVAHPGADNALGEAVRSALDQSQNSWLRSIEIGVSESEVTLTGEVPNFHLKQLALAAVVEVPGVTRVRNNLHVTAANGK